MNTENTTALPQETPAPMPGIIGGQYQPLRELGAGGMGRIYYGLHLMTEQPVAIKVLHPELTSDATIRARFLSEARTLARLEHHNIVQWKNSLEDENGIYLIMQFVEGENVEDRIQKRNALTLDEVIPIAVQALMGLDYVHSKDVIHRDLKPSNILLTQDGDVKLADFGISRILGHARHTQTGMAIGTFLYMAPEQILAKAMDHRSDIYAMGITLYEMLTGQAPFQGENEYEICKQHLEKNLPSVRKTNPSLPKAIDTILRKATEKKPEKRYQSAREFIGALADAFPEPVLRTHQLTQMLEEAKGKPFLQATAPRRWGCFRFLFRVTLFCALFVTGAWGFFHFFDPAEPVPVVYHHDNFHDNEACWPLGTQLKATFMQGHEDYRVTTKAGRQLTTFCPSKTRPLPENAIVESWSRLHRRSSKESGQHGNHGLALYFSKQGETPRSRGYFFGIDPSRRRFIIVRSQKGTKLNLTPWRGHPAIKAKQRNHLKVVVQNDVMTFLINGTQVTTISDAQFRTGHACLFVQQGGTQVQFSRFRLSKLRDPSSS